MVEMNTLLVPVDFSQVSRGAFEQALEMVQGDDAVVILLHVIDPAHVEFAAELGFGQHASVLAAARARAERQLAEWQATGNPRVEVQPIVSEGVPFLEILRKAEDFQVDAILMGRFGKRGGIEKLLFGSTAERVIRGTTRAVIVLPVEV